VIVYFGVEPADKAAVATHVTLTSTPAVEGAWAWIKHDDGRWGLDYRTKDYWPAGTQIHLSAQLYGVQLAPGAYGAADVTSDFTIGRNQVVLADANSHNLVVQQDGVTVASYDASYGSGDLINDPNRVTRSGTHIVMDKQENTLMSNPAYGYSNVPEKWAVRISDNGEFIHQNQNTVSDQGVVNVSHGCINLSADSAQAYFASAIYGDPVQVTGTSVQAPDPRPAARRPVRHTRTVAVTRRAQHGVLVGGCPRREGEFRWQRGGGVAGQSFSVVAPVVEYAFDVAAVDDPHVLADRADAGQVGETIEEAGRVGTVEPGRDVVVSWRPAASADPDGGVHVVMFIR